MNQPLDHMNEGLAPPVPPPELKVRTLQATRAVMTANGGDDIWLRLWRSQPIRLAWALSVAALLFGHIVIGAGAPSGPADTIRPVMAAAAIHHELAEVIDVERVTTELPGWEIQISWDRVETEPPTTDEDQS
jgi:hypothetical protein